VKLYDQYRFIGLFSSTLMAGTTFAQKVLSRVSCEEAVPGQVVNARVDLAMSHESANIILESFGEIGASRVWDPERLVILFDHRVPAYSIKAAESQRIVRKFAKEQDLPYFYDMGEGICHQVLPEKGHVLPGMFIVGTDSHTTTYGAFGAFSTGIGATEMAAVWATGKIWMRVPETMRIRVDGALSSRVTSKDLILDIIGTLGADGAEYMCVEFVGPAVDSMTVESRMTISNMSMEMGAKTGVCFPDGKTVSWLRQRTLKEFEPVLTDPSARIDQRESFDVSSLEPKIACPHMVDNVVNVGEVAGAHVDQAVLGSCTNGRLEDLAAAEEILRGKEVAKGTRMIVVPASREVYLEAMESGVAASLLRSKAIIVNPGCGPCLGGHQGVLAAGEVCISSTNRNYRGRMGSPEAKIYLGSPYTVAASALRGEITDPREV